MHMLQLVFNCPHIKVFPGGRSDLSFSMKAEDKGCLETAKARVSCSNTVVGGSKILLPYFHMLLPKAQSILQRWEIIGKTRIEAWRNTIKTHGWCVSELFPTVLPPWMISGISHNLNECSFISVVDAWTLLYNFIFLSVNRCVGVKIKVSEWLADLSVFKVWLPKCYVT